MTTTHNTTGTTGTTGTTDRRTALHAAGQVLRTAAQHLTGAHNPTPGPSFPDRAVTAFRAGTPGVMLPGEVMLRLRDITDLLHGTMSARAREDLVIEALTLLGNITTPYTGPLLLTTRTLDAALHGDGINLDALISDTHEVTLEQMTDMDTP